VAREESHTRRDVLARAIIATSFAIVIVWLIVAAFAEGLR